MRTDGYLFTYAEMSASIDDTTFQANDTPITDPNNKIVTVQDAMDMIVIEPLNGPSNRCPSWDELIDNGGGGGGDFKVVLTLTTGVLSGYCYNGTPPYNYFFSCTPIGSCSSYSIGQPTFLNAGAVVTTTFSATAYQDVHYILQCFATDSAGNSATSNTDAFNPCLIPETLITMADGTQKQLGSLQIGDLLYDSIITGIEPRIVNEIYSINDGLLKASKWHIHILSNGKLVQSFELKPGDYLIDKWYWPVEIQSVDVLYGTFDVINISTNTETYIANGIRTHNKVQCP